MELWSFRRMVISPQTKFASPHNRSHFAPYKSYLAPYRSYFAPCKKLVKLVVNFSVLKLELKVAHMQKDRK